MCEFRLPLRLIPPHIPLHTPLSVSLNRSLALRSQPVYHAPAGPSIHDIADERTEQHHLDALQSHVHFEIHDETDNQCGPHNDRPDDFPDFSRILHESPLSKPHCFGMATAYAPAVMRSKPT